MDPAIPVLLQYGAIGVLALLAVLATRSLFNRMQEDHDQEIARLVALGDAAQARADRLEQELSRLNGAVQGVHLDTLVRVAAVTESATRAVADALAAVRRS